MNRILRLIRAHWRNPRWLLSELRVELDIWLGRIHDYEDGFPP